MNGRPLDGSVIVPSVMRVYHRERAGRPLRLIWTLEEAGEPYELIVMDSEEGAGEEHLSRHPLGRVPVLEDDDGFVFESAAVCLHIADLHPEAKLIPSPGTHARALVYQWATFAPAELEPALFEAWVQAKKDPERSAKAREKFFRATGAVEDALDGSEFLVDEQFSVADIMVGTALLFTTRAGFFDQLPSALAEYTAGLGERPAFQRALQQTFG